MVGAGVVGAGADDFAVGALLDDVRGPAGGARHDEERREHEHRHAHAVVGDGAEPIEVGKHFLFGPHERFDALGDAEEAQVALLDYTAAIDRFKAAQEWVRANAASQASRDFMEESIVDVRTRQVLELLRQQIKDEKEAVK